MAAWLTIGTTYQFVIWGATAPAIAFTSSRDTNKPWKQVFGKRYDLSNSRRWPHTRHFAAPTRGKRPIWPARDLPRSSLWECTLFFVLRENRKVNCLRHASVSLLRATFVHLYKIWPNKSATGRSAGPTLAANWKFLFDNGKPQTRSPSGSSSGDFKFESW